MSSGNGRVAIVTGGTFGIGRAITLGLASRGYRVVAFGLEGRQMASIAENGIASLREEVAHSKAAVTLLEADVSVCGDVRRVVETAISTYGRIDALVHNAAIGPLGTVLDTTEEVFDRIMAVNLKGAFLCSQAVIPHLRAAGGGAIVLIGSGAGWGKPNMAAYSASKGGLFALAAAMAYDHLHEGIRVNTVVPGGGGIITGMSLGRTGGDVERLTRAAAGTAAGRAVTGDDVASAVAFLLSDEAATVSGTVLDVGCFAHQGGPVPPRRALEPEATAGRSQ